jgi:hypothetical protein
MKKVACFFGSMAFRVLLIGTMAIFGTVGNVSGSPPTIVGDPAAISMHWVSDFPYVDENGNAYPRREDYGISFNAIVHDEQGPDNILSVIVTDLEGNEYLLNDEGLQGDLNVHDGVYQLMQRGLSTPPNFSTYVFTVTNKQGEFSSKLDVIDQICDVGRGPDAKQRSDCHATQSDVQLECGHRRHSIHGFRRQLEGNAVANIGKWNIGYIRRASFNEWRFLFLGYQYHRYGE